MYNSSGIYAGKALIILSKEALFSEESDFLEGFDKRRVQDSGLKNCCSGIVFDFEEKGDALRFMQGSPAKLYRQIKGGRLYLR